MRARNPLPPTSHLIGAGLVIGVLGWLFVRKASVAQAWFNPAPPAAPPPVAGPAIVDRQGRGHF